MFPEFRPRIYDEPGIGTLYDDGRVLGTVHGMIIDQKRTLVITEWTAQFLYQGHTKTALQWFRQEGFESIIASSVGLIEDGVGDAATSYWEHIHSLGLVDILLDDNGDDITPKSTMGRVPLEYPAPEFNV